MTTNQDERSRRFEWPLLLLSGGVLLVYLYYTISFVLVTPYPGLLFSTITEGWLVTDSVQDNIMVDDVLVQIADLKYESYQENRLLVPFGEYEAGDQITPVITLDGRSVTLEMPQFTLDARLRRLVSTLLFFPFWIAGSTVLWFLWPRDVSWRLLIAFMYLTAIWAALGTIANWQIGGSRILLGIVQWLMVPVFIHLHLEVPNTLLTGRKRRLLLVIYLLCIVLAVTEVLQTSPRGLALLGLVAAVFSSIGLLIYRSLRSSGPVSDRNAARLMLAGIGLAFGPGILVVIGGDLLEITIPSALGLTIAFLSLAVLPIFYTYTIYKRQLGALEFRANRLISLYSFILIYPTIFLLVLLLGEEWIASSAGRTFYLLAISIVFALGTPPALNRFQHALNRLAYGTVHNPEEILEVFARKIPSALTREALIALLTNDVMPTLLVRQSALSLLVEDNIEVLYTQGLQEYEIIRNEPLIQLLLHQSGRYLPPTENSPQIYRWVRLTIPLITREKIIGVLLLGRRDPDDFYPRDDVDLLQNLANQIAPVIENIRLYEALQEHADGLAVEVSRRTSELQKEKDRTQAILDSAGEGIVFTDPDGVILYANAAMSLLSGFSSGELPGKTLELWQAEDLTTEAYQEMWMAIKNGHGWSDELLLRRKDGTYRDVNLTIAPMRGEDNTLTGFVGVQSDISKLKEVDRVKSNIISSVSHEMKTPLTTIKTYLMLLKRGKAEKRDTYLEILDHESDRLTRIIEGLLDLSALDTGKIQARFEPLNVITAAGEVVVSCITQAKTKNILVEVDANGSLPTVLADRNLLAQLLTNLIVNAINYTPENGRVAIRAGTGELDDLPAVWISVIDNGPGISPQEIPNLFDRFYRGQAAIETGAPGTGLGLAICQEIAERHRGKIEVRSELGKGTSFTLWLPSLSHINDQSTVIRKQITV